VDHLGSNLGLIAFRIHNRAKFKILKGFPTPCDFRDRLPGQGIRADGKRDDPNKGR